MKHKALGLLVLNRAHTNSRGAEFLWVFVSVPRNTASGNWLWGPGSGRSILSHRPECCSGRTAPFLASHLGSLLFSCSPGALCFWEAGCLPTSLPGRRGPWLPSPCCAAAEWTWCCSSCCWGFRHIPGPQPGRVGPESRATARGHPWRGGGWPQLAGMQQPVGLALKKAVPGCPLSPSYTAEPGLSFLWGESGLLF